MQLRWHLETLGHGIRRVSTRARGAQQSSVQHCISPGRLLVCLVRPGRHHAAMGLSDRPQRADVPGACARGPLRCVQPQWLSCGDRCAIDHLAVHMWEPCMRCMPCRLQMQRSVARARAVFPPCHCHCHLVFMLLWVQGHLTILPACGTCESGVPSTASQAIHAWSHMSSSSPTLVITSSPPALTAPAKYGAARLGSWQTASRGMRALSWQQTSPRIRGLW